MFCRNNVCTMLCTMLVHSRIRVDCRKLQSITIKITLNFNNILWNITFFMKFTMRLPLIYLFKKNKKILEYDYVYIARKKILELRLMKKSIMDIHFITHSSLIWHWLCNLNVMNPFFLHPSPATLFTSVSPQNEQMD